MKYFIVILLLASCTKQTIGPVLLNEKQESLQVLQLKSIVCAGNSLTWGYHLQDPSTQSYPAQLQDSLPTGTVYNKGVNGITTEQMQARVTTDILPNYDSTKNNICIAWEIGNDIYFNGISADSAVSNFMTYCDSVRSHGFKVVVINLPYRNNYYMTGSLITPGGDDTTSYSLKIKEVNDELKTTWRTFSDKFVKVPFSTYDTINYLSDHTHLSQEGYRKIDSVILKNLPK